MCGSTEKQRTSQSVYSMRCSACLPVPAVQLQPPLVLEQCELEVQSAPSLQAHAQGLIQLPARR